MLIYVYAYEGHYQGLHGVENMCVMEVSNDLGKAKAEINEWGHEASNELIYSFGLEEEYFGDYDGREIDEDEWYDATCDCGWYAYKIREDVNLSERELDELCCQLGDELFRKEYCEGNALV